jgi:hypothetical protein
LVAPPLALPLALPPGAAVVDVVGAAAVVAVVEDEVAKPTETPITAINATVATIHRIFLLGSIRCSQDGRTGGGLFPAGSAGAWSFMIGLLSAGGLETESADGPCEVTMRNM